MELSKNIRFYRKSMNITQEQLANMLNGKKMNMFLSLHVHFLLYSSKYNYQNRYK